MLSFYQWLATRLERVKAGIRLVFFASLGVFIWTLLFSSGSAGNAYMLLSVLACTWALFLLLFIAYFIAPVSKPEQGDRFFVRIKKRVRIGLRWALALTVSGLSVGIILMTFRLLGILITDVRE